MKKLLYIFSFIFIALWASTAQASLVLSPTRIEMVVEDGQTLPPIQITNKGNGAVEINVYAEWGGHDVQGTIRPIEGIEYDTAQFLKFSPEKFILEPEKTQIIEVQVSFPADFTGPAIYPIIFVQATRPDSEKAQIATALRLSVITLLTRDTPASPDAEIAGVDIFQNGTGQPIDFRFIINNTGDIHMSALGVVNILDESGRQIAELGMDSTTLLPGNARWLRTNWQPVMLMPGKYSYEGKVEFDFGGVSETAGHFNVISPWQVEQRRGEITGLKLLTSTVEEGVSVAGVFHNRGNVPLDVQGNISLSSGTTSKEQELDLGKVAPKTSAPLELFIAGEGLEEGGYDLSINLAAEDVMWQEKLVFNIKERVDFLEGELTDFFVDITDHGPVFGLTFANSGTLPFEVMGVVEIHDDNNVLMGYLEVPMTLLAGGDLKDYRLDYEGSLSEGKYNAVVTLIYDALVLRNEQEFFIK